MNKRPRMKERYRRFSFLSDIEGIKNALREMRGFFFPKQPLLNNDIRRIDTRHVPDEEWFTQTIKEKIIHHPENAMEYPYYNEQIFAEPLIGFVRGNDPIFDQFKQIIGLHHFTPW
jgi:epoxyqueuosine reductase